MCRPPWEGRTAATDRCVRHTSAMYGRPVLGRINGDLEIADGACFSPAIKLFMSLNAAMLRYCGIMATLNEGAGARERDSTRAVAPRPGSRVGEGAGKARRHCQQRLSCGKRVYFVSNCPELHLRTGIMAKGDWRRRTRTTKASGGGRRRGLLRPPGGMEKYLHA